MLAGAELPLVGVPVVGRGVQALLIIGLHQLVHLVHPAPEANQSAIKIP